MVTKGVFGKINEKILKSEKNFKMGEFCRIHIESSKQNNHCRQCQASRAQDLRFSFVILDNIRLPHYISV